MQVFQGLTTVFVSLVMISALVACDNPAAAHSDRKTALPAAAATLGAVQKENISGKYRLVGGYLKRKSKLSGLSLTGTLDTKQLSQYKNGWYTADQIKSDAYLARALGYPNGLPANVTAIRNDWGSNSSSAVVNQKFDAKNNLLVQNADGSSSVTDQKQTVFMGPKGGITSIHDKDGSTHFNSDGSMTTYGPQGTNYRLETAKDGSQVFHDGNGGKVVTPAPGTTAPSAAPANSGIAVNSSTAASSNTAASPASGGHGDNQSTSPANAAQGIESPDADWNQGFADQDAVASSGSIPAEDAFDSEIPNGDVNAAGLGQSEGETSGDPGNEFSGESFGNDEYASVAADAMSPEEKAAADAL